MTSVLRGLIADHGAPPVLCVGRKFSCAIHTIQHLLSVAAAIFFRHLVSPHAVPMTALLN